MTLPASAVRFPRPALLAACCCALALLLAAPAAAQDPSPPPAAQTVEVASLEALLPAPDGWTKTRSGGARIPLSDTTGYTLAEAVFTRDAMEVRVTVADSAALEDALIALAAMVVLLPDDHVETIEPATTIRRMAVDTFPAAERWDAEKREGEFVIVLNRRFVAKAEGRGLDSLDTLKAIVQKIDLKKLAALK